MTAAADAAVHAQAPFVPVRKAASARGKPSQDWQGYIWR